MILGPLFLPSAAVSLGLGYAYAYPRVAKLWGKYTARLSGFFVPLVLTALWSLPARAQFLQGAEGFFEELFPDSTELIPFLFGSLRAIYVIYIIVQGIRAFTAVREGEDWKEVLKVPAFIIVLVTVIDAAIGLVIGA